MSKSHLRVVPPTTVLRTVMPSRPSQRRAAHPRAPHRGRGRAADRGRQAQPLGPPRRHHDPRRLPARPAVSELVDLRWDQIDFRTATLHVRRVKKGTPATHPILGDELRALRRLQREQEPKSPFVFTSERGAPFTHGRLRSHGRARRRRGQAWLQGSPAHAAPRLRLRAGQQGPRHARAAGLPRPPNIQHTVRYTELSPTRFKDFWRS